MLTELAYLNLSSNRLCGRIPKGTQFDTFNVASFEMNKCLCGSPLQPCQEKKKKITMEGVNIGKGQGFLSHVDEHVSLIALGLGVGIGISGVVSVMILWKTARHWMMPPGTQPFYGVYRFPK